MPVINEKMCIICRVNFDTECIPAETVTLSEKGIQSLKECGELRGDVELTDYLSAVPGIVIAHIQCRKSYTNKKSCVILKRRSGESAHEVTPPNVLPSDSVTPPNVPKSDAVGFNLNGHCPPCDKAAVGKAGRPKQQEVSSMMILEFRDALLKVTSDENDGWAIEVQFSSVKDHTLFTTLRQCLTVGSHVSKRHQVKWQFCLYSLAGCPSWRLNLIMLIRSSPL